MMIIPPRIRMSTPNNCPLCSYPLYFLLQQYCADLFTLSHSRELIPIRLQIDWLSLCGIGDSREMVLMNEMITRLRVDKDKPKGWFKGNWKGDYSKLCYFGPLWPTLSYSGLLWANWATLSYSELLWTSSIGLWTLNLGWFRVTNSFKHFVDSLDSWTHTCPLSCFSDS